RGDHVVITGGGGLATIKGLSVQLHVANGEAIDRLALSGLDGADSFDVTGFGGGGLGLRLSGGGGADRFVFGPGSAGADVEILEFQAHSAFPEADRIVLNGFADDSFASAVAHHHIVQSGQDVLISDGLGATVRLLNVSVTDLGASDFLFR